MLKEQYFPPKCGQSGGLQKRIMDKLKELPQSCTQVQKLEYIPSLVIPNFDTNIYKFNADCVLYCISALISAI